MESDGCVSHYIGELSAEDQAAWEVGHAWQKAEGALPEGWNAVILRRRMGGWIAETYEDGNAENSANGWGQTLAAAIRALVVKLRER